MWIVTLLSYLPSIFVFWIIVVQAGSIFTSLKLRNFSLEGCYGIALFILFSFLSSRLAFVSAEQAMLFSASILLFIAIYQTFHGSRLSITLIKQKLTKNIAMIFLLFFSLCVLARLTFLNGLHDEYQHYAAIQLLSFSESLPGLHPFSPGMSFSFFYHTGLYPVAWIFHKLAGLNIESALDSSKLFLLLPLPFLLSQLFSFKHYKRKTLFIFLPSALFIGLMGGPSFFLLDNLSANIFMQGNSPQLWMPVVYELAGLTWGGLSFFIAALITLQKMRVDTPQKRKLAAALLMVVALALSNLGFLFAFMIAAPWFFAFEVFTEKKRAWLSAILITLTFLVLLLLIFPTFISLRPYESLGWPFVQEILSDGIRYRTHYVLPFTLSFFTAFGLSWLWAILLFLEAIRKKSQNIEPWFGIFLFLPLLSALLRFSGDDLALNKLWRPVFLLLPLFTLYCIQFFSPSRKKVLLTITVVLWLFSLPSSLRYLFHSGTENLQRFWISSTQMEEMLHSLPSNSTPQQFVTTDIQLLYRLANSVPSQVQLCAPEDTNCFNQTSASYFIQEREGATESAFFNNVIYQNEDFFVLGR